MDKLSPFKEPEPRTNRLNVTGRGLRVEETAQNFQSLDETVENVRKQREMKLAVGEMKLGESIKEAKDLSEAIHTYFQQRGGEIVKIKGLEEHRDFRELIKCLERIDNHSLHASLYLQQNGRTIENLSYWSDRLEPLSNELSEKFTPFTKFIETRVKIKEEIEVQLAILEKTITNGIKYLSDQEKIIGGEIIESLTQTNQEARTHAKDAKQWLNENGRSTNDLQTKCEALKEANQGISQTLEQLKALHEQYTKLDQKLSDLHLQINTNDISIEKLGEIYQETAKLQKQVENQELNNDEVKSSLNLEKLQEKSIDLSIEIQDLSKKILEREKENNLLDHYMLEMNKLNESNISSIKSFDSFQNFNRYRQYFIDAFSKLEEFANNNNEIEQQDKYSTKEVIKAINDFTNHRKNLSESLTELLGNLSQNMQKIYKDTKQYLMKNNEAISLIDDKITFYRNLTNFNNSSEHIDQFLGKAQQYLDLPKDEVTIHGLLEETQSLVVLYERCDAVKNSIDLAKEKFLLLEGDELKKNLHEKLDNFHTTYDSTYSLWRENEGRLRAVFSLQFFSKMEATFKEIDGQYFQTEKSTIVNQLVLGQEKSKKLLEDIEKISDIKEQIEIMFQFNEMFEKVSNYIYPSEDAKNTKNELYSQNLFVSEQISEWEATLEQWQPSIKYLAFNYRSLLEGSTALKKLLDQIKNQEDVLPKSSFYNKMNKAEEISEFTDNFSELHLKPYLQSEIDLFNCKLKGITKILPPGYVDFSPSYQSKLSDLSKKHDMLRNDRFCKNSNLLDESKYYAGIFNLSEQRNSFEKIEGQISTIQKYDSKIVDFIENCAGNMNDNDWNSSTKLLDLAENKENLSELLKEFQKEALDAAVRTSTMKSETVKDFLSTHPSHKSLIVDYNMFPKFPNDLLELDQSISNVSYGLSIEDMSKNIQRLAEKDRALSEQFEEVRRIPDAELVVASTQRGRDLSTITRKKSAEREARGMNEKVIDASFAKFYASCAVLVKELQPSDSIRTDIEKLVQERVLKGNVDDYCYVEVWPRTPDNAKIFENDPPYHVYVTKEAMATPHIFRDADQSWRSSNIRKPFPKEWSIEELQKQLDVNTLPSAFSEALNASDITGYLYKLGIKRLEGDVPSSPLRETIQLFVSNDKTNQVLSSIVKPGKKATFHRDTEDEKAKFDATLGTPNGQIAPFTLAQHSDKVGSGEIIQAEVDMALDGKAKYIKFRIDEKKDSI